MALHLCTYYGLYWTWWGVRERELEYWEQAGTIVDEADKKIVRKCVKLSIHKNKTASFEVKLKKDKKEKQGNNELLYAFLKIVYI